MARLTFALLLLALSSSATAATIALSGSFSATDSTPAAGTPGSISGTWASEPFEVPAGFAQLTVALTSLSFSPSPYEGSFAFDTANTALLLTFDGGALLGVHVGAVGFGINAVLGGTSLLGCGRRAGSERERAAHGSVHCFGPGARGPRASRGGPLRDRRAPSETRGELTRAQRVAAVP